MTQLDALVKHLEDPARLLAGFARPLDDDLVSVGVSRHPETALDARDVLIVVSEDDRGGGVVGKGDGDFGRFGFAKRRIADRRAGGDARRRTVLRLQIGSLPRVLPMPGIILHAVIVPFSRRWRDNASLKRMGLRADDFDLCQRADQRRRPFAEHGLHIG